MNDEQQKKSEEVTMLYLFMGHPFLVLVFLAIIFVLFFLFDSIDCKTLVIALSILALADAIFFGMIWLSESINHIGQKTKK